LFHFGGSRGRGTTNEKMRFVDRGRQHAGDLAKAVQKGARQSRPKKRPGPEEETRAGPIFSPLLEALKTRRGCPRTARGGPKGLSYLREKALGETPGGDTRWKSL